MVTSLAGSNAELSSHLIAIIIAINGIGQIVSGPIANALEAHSFPQARFAYGSASFVSDLELERVPLEAH